MREAPARVRVSVIEVAAETYRLVFGRLGLVLELGWLPLLVLLAASILPDLVLVGPILPAVAALGVTLPDTIEAVVAIVCLNAFAVRWHQTLLFGRAHAVPAGLFRRAYARFLVYTALIYLASLLLMATIIATAAGDAAPAAAAPSGTVLAVVSAAAGASLLLWLVTARFSLLFPAAAYGAPLAWGAAWRLMRGNTWRLVGCGFLTCAPFVIAVATVLMAILSAARIGAGEATAPSLGFLLLRGIVDTVTNFIVVALGATILCGFYRRIALGIARSAADQG